MGLAASQARFLGLTARMSNTEYQGQQINQQRTALSNESANIYNQMMDLTVPTPPSTSDYMKTNYVLEDSSFGSSSNFTIKSAVKYGLGEDRYTVKLGYTRTEAIGASNTDTLSSVTRTTNQDTGKNSYTIKMAGSTILWDETKKPYETNKENNTTVQAIEKNRLYLVDSTVKSFNLAGYDEANEKLAEVDSEYQKGGTLYFYEGTDGKNYFITQGQLDKLTADSNFNEDGSYKYDPKNPTPTYVQLGYSINQTKDYTVDVKASIASASNGRYSTITIDSQEGIPTNLKGATFSITTTQTQDEDAYNDAFNDYEYQKALYEQNISDLNAKTKVIQQEDQQLELRLKQLDTERNALNTEIDSVKKVIQDNVDKTFKIFA